jgi:hypothetical protein
VEAQAEALDQTGDAGRAHLELVALAEVAEGHWVCLGDAPHVDELGKEAVEAGGRGDLENPAPIWSDSVRARPTMPLRSASGDANNPLSRVVDVRSCTRLSGIRFSAPSIAIFAVDSTDAGTRNLSLRMKPSVPGLVASEER